MTKLRAPLSFAQAITTIASVIGWPEVQRIVRRSNRTVRLWSESDRKGSPTLEQARALDCAYIAAGGASAPILESYALQVEVMMASALACRIALADDIAFAARESADAVATSVLVAQPGASDTLIYRAIAETEEGVGAMTRLLSRLKSFLPGNRADQERSGDQQ